MELTPEEVLEILGKIYPSPKSELNYGSIFQLLIAVILSAQATDVSVNKATPELFRLYPTAYELAEAKLEEIMELLKTIGLYKNKSKFIIKTSKILVNEFNGEVPKTREELMTLPGVGRKTANVVLAEGFNIPAIAVDTHVERVCKRLKWVPVDATVREVENKLMELIPSEKWGTAHHQLLLFGRYHSTARDKRDIYQVLREIENEYNNK